MEKRTKKGGGGNLAEVRGGGGVGFLATEANKTEQGLFTGSSRGGIGRVA